MEGVNVERQTFVTVGGSSRMWDTGVVLDQNEQQIYQIQSNGAEQLYIVQASQEWTQVYQTSIFFSTALVVGPRFIPYLVTCSLG